MKSDYDITISGSKNGSTVSYSVNVLNEYPDRSQETREEFVKNREIRIKKVLNLAGLKTEADYDVYEEALQASTGGFSII